MSYEDWFQQIRESFRKVSKAFEKVEGAQLIPSFSPVSEEEYTPDPEQKDEEMRLDLRGTWVREAESKPSSTFLRDFRHVESEFFLKYFVDGSVRSIRTLDGVEGNFIFPIVVGQIGAASITRNEQAQPVKHLFETDIILLIPLSKLSDTLRNQLENQLVGTILKLEDTLDHGEDIREYSELRARAARRAKYLMAKKERQVIEKCVNSLTDGNQLVIMDGSLFTLFKEAQVHEDKIYRVIAVSKSFSIRPLILMEQYLNRRDCIRQLINLKEGERTDAIELHIDPHWVVTWYQRIRPPEQVESPLDGIVKVEVHFANYPACKSPNERRNFNGDWSTLWDKIAYSVYAERMPVPFHEERWHALLYPIYCCERLLKSSFLSIEALYGLCMQII